MDWIKQYLLTVTTLTDCDDGPNIAFKNVPTQTN